MFCTVRIDGECLTIQYDYFHERRNITELAIMQHYSLPVHVHNNGAYQEPKNRKGAPLLTPDVLDFHIKC